jgi:purine catabolism regulator
MIESLLNGDLPVDAVNKRAERLGLDLSHAYTVIVAQFPDINYKAAIIARKLASIFKNALCHYRSNSLIMFYPVSSDILSTDLRNLSRQISEQLTTHLRMKVSLGLGRAYTGAAGLRASYQEAEGSLALGKKLFGEGSASFFGDLGVYRLLLSAGEDELKSFYKDGIGRLTDYENQRDGELLNTLEAVLRYPTLADTAKALHVHRNTLLYRIQRIQEIANVNLDDGETRLLLHLALRAGEVIRSS